MYALGQTKWALLAAGLLLGSLGKAHAENATQTPHSKANPVLVTPTKPSPPSQETKAYSKAQAAAASRGAEVAAFLDGAPPPKKERNVARAVGKATSVSRRAKLPARGVIEADMSDALRGLENVVQRTPSLGLRARVPGAIVHEETMHIGTQSLKQAQIQSVLRANQNQIDTCHVRLVARGGAPTGEVNMEFVVEPLGHTSHVKVTASGKNARRFERCIKTRIKRWRFPSTNVESYVAYALVFGSAGID